MKNAVLPEVIEKRGPVNLLTAINNAISRQIKISYLLIFLFAYTAVSKLADVEIFKGAMAKSPVLRPYAHELAYIIPISELIACLLLLFPLTKKWGYYLSLALLTVFTGYIIFILSVYSTDLPCTCGGVISRLTWTQHLLLNSVFMLLSVKALRLYDRSQIK
jgi:hypothetical protein